jgi:hypothetical protein
VYIKEKEIMNLPNFLPDKPEDRRILGEFYDTFAKMQWFVRAELHENHASQMRKTIEATVVYLPTLEMKDIITWAHKYQLGLEWKVLSNQ